MSGLFGEKGWMHRMDTTNAPKRVRRNTTLTRIARHWQLYLLVLVPMAAVFILHWVPVYGLQIAFRKYSAKLGFTGSEWVGLKYFEQFFNYPKFWAIIWNTLRINLYSRCRSYWRWCSTT